MPRVLAENKLLEVTRIRVCVVLWTKCNTVHEILEELASTISVETKAISPLKTLTCSRLGLDLCVAG